MSAEAGRKIPGIEPSVHVLYPMFSVTPLKDMKLSMIGPGSTKKFGASVFLTKFRPKMLGDHAIIPSPLIARVVSVWSQSESSTKEAGSRTKEIVLETTCIAIVLIVHLSRLVLTWILGSMRSHAIVKSVQTRKARSLSSCQVERVRDHECWRILPRGIRIYVGQVLYVLHETISQNERVIRVRGAITSFQ
jgi:hypothetical protein